MRGPDVAIAVLLQLQAEVDIVERDRQALLVEPTHREVGLALDEQARSGDRRELLDQPRAADVAWRMRFEVLVRMPGHAADADDDTAVLQRAIGIQQLRADSADI